MRYAWIKQHRDSFAVTSMCRTLNVSTSGYYRWLKAGPGLRAQRSARIRTSIKKVYDESHGIYGSYKIADRLKEDDSLETVCRNTVAAAMREMGLKSKVSKKFSPTTTVSDPSNMAAPNVLNQSFKAGAPNRKWVSRIYRPQPAGFIWLLSWTCSVARLSVGRFPKVSPRRWSAQLFVTLLNRGSLTRRACFITAIEARNTPALTTSKLSEHST